MVIIMKQNPKSNRHGTKQTCQLFVTHITFCDNNCLLGATGNVSIYSNGDVSEPLLLMDRMSCLPLVANHAHLQSTPSILMCTSGLVCEKII